MSLRGTRALGFKTAAPMVVEMSESKVRTSAKLKMKDFILAVALTEE